MKGDLIRKRCVTRILDIIQTETSNNNNDRILHECNSFLSMPNQCAWTDSCVQNIIEYGNGHVCTNNNLQEEYDKCITKLANSYYF